MKTVILTSFENPDKACYQLDLSSNKVVRQSKILKPGDEVESDGFGEYVQLQNPKDAKVFVGFFVLKGMIYFQMDHERHLIDDSCRFELKLPLIGRDRCLTLIQKGQIKSVLNYIYRTADYFEDSDGDICWRIEQELKTPQTRQTFLNLPRSFRI